MHHRHKSERSTKTAPSVRMLRVGEQLRHILSELLLAGAVHDPTLMRHPISVTEVRMSTDLRYATVYVKPMLGRKEARVLAALEENRAFLQQRVAAQLRLKYAARLRFVLDQSFEAAEHIDSLLRQLDQLQTGAT